MAIEWSSNAEIVKGETEILKLLKKMIKNQEEIIELLKSENEVK